MLDEVVDPDDVGVLHLGQELPLGDGSLERVGIADVEQALQHHPAVADVVVAGQVDPAKAAERQAAEHLVLSRYQLAGRQLRGEGEPRAAVAAESLRQAGPAVAAPAHLVPAVAAKPPVLRYLRIRQDRGGRIPVRHRRDLHQPGAEAAPPGG